MRKGKVFYKNHFAGVICETDDGEFTFQYDIRYVKGHPRNFIIFTMPVSEKTYTENRLFSSSFQRIPKNSHSQFLERRKNSNGCILNNWENNWG